MTKNLIQLLKDAAIEFDFEWQALCAFAEVESGGDGFNSATGKIIIQFEPAWFKRKAPYAPSGAWSVNKVERQTAEWLAFNNAFTLNQNAAMEATSIGFGQIMGFHYKRLGYATVGEMWDDAKKGLHRQVWQLCKFIKTDANLQKALNKKDWHTVAKLYNGGGYLELAKKIGREPYNVSLGNAYKKYKTL